MRRKLGWLKSKERKVGKEKIHRLFPRPRRPLSGGFAILISLTVGVIAFNWPPGYLPLFFLALVWFFALIGLLDDLRKTGGRGLSEKEKLALQSAAGFAFAYLLHSGASSIRFGLIRLPFAEMPVDLGMFYPFLGMFVIVAASNAVNLTDGMDGLAAGQMVIASFFMLGFCVLLQKPLATGIFLSLMASCLGFLIFNYPPARLLMGDMGSLALGAALGAGAMFLGIEAFLPLVGAVFVINTLSVIVQVGTVRGLWRLVRLHRHRTTEHFRPFLCTPLHHHFQWLGWPEKSTLRLFWGMGAGFGVFAVLGFKWGGAWVAGMLLIPLPLILAATQKLLRGSYFIGLTSEDEGPHRLALFQGMPVEVIGKKLYRLIRETALSESMLAPGAAEGLLWRPMTEIEARVALGSLFMQQHLGDEALAEWEEIPVRNLLLRESTVMRLARLYYSRDRLLEAIRLWEALPRTRLISMPSVQEIVRGARIRLAELASKSYRQCLSAFAHTQAGKSFDTANLARQLTLSLRFNRDLLSLLASSADLTGGGAGDPQGFRPLSSSYRRAERTLRERIRTLGRALSWCKKAQEQQGTLPQKQTPPPPDDFVEQVREWLGFETKEIQQALGEAFEAKAEITSFQPSAKASRNAIARLGVEWFPAQAGPTRVVAKSYLEERVAFFSACYRRERALLEMLSGYGCPVPGPCGGRLEADRALLILEDTGMETLAERLEGLDIQARERLLSAAIVSLASLHRQSSLHLTELTEEVRKIDKEVLSAQYHLSAFRIALERLFGIPKEGAFADRIEDMLHQYQPVARLLASRPKTFIHFEFTPQHILLDESKLTIFDFEQGTVGPAEFDLACLIYSPEADLPEESVQILVDIYEEKAGNRLDPRALDYASLAKSLTYAGAALNFYNKFGGQYHFQRLEWYIRHCLSVLGRHAPLSPLRRLLAPWLEQAHKRGLSFAGNQASPEDEAIEGKRQGGDES
ncbi:MAG: phosphotransferase [Armatimonadetes bacterium]|nr:phosphotransferase [Armatimonadota bacterium]NIM23792.1 phosphotransferase [Armatimonadota bacterium]NIM67669.1 phosphotransferase [Armatimonadota bacterium]NIM76185.1 phosphotransferase [Armatimonadota bacterium]NIN05870.1 phosphotransferase [Armatimonadota bacterium]